MSQLFKHELARELDDHFRGLGLTEGNLQCNYHGQCKASCEWEPDGRGLSAMPNGPYVGERYDEHRVLFVGINTSGFQQTFYDCYNWITKGDSATSRYIDGAIHRTMAMYLGDKEAKPEKTGQYFAFTNATKCTASGKAGEPTSTMRGNCLIKAAYVAREIEILQPRIIVCLGEEQFYHIRNHFFERAEKVDEKLADVILRLNLESTCAVMIRLYNPGQGYQNIRAAWKRVCAEPAVPLPQSYARFLPNGLDAESQRREIERMVDRATGVDGENLLYDYVIGRLFDMARGVRCAPGSNE